MEVLILTTFVSVLIAAAGVALFVWSVRARTFDHSDRLAILPLDDSAIVASPFDGSDGSPASPTSTFSPQRAPDTEKPSS